MSWSWEPHKNAKYRYDYTQWIAAIAKSADGIRSAKEKGVKAEERSHTGTYLGLVRQAAELDFFFFVYYILGHRFFNTPWHVERIYELADNHNMTIDLWPREFGKSTLITQDLNMWLILKDPERTVGILSYNRALAKSKLLAIKTSFETNGLMRAVWKHVIWENPKEQAPKWSLDDGIVLKRTSVVPEGTFEAWGLIDGQPTGKHFSDLMLDDLVTQNSVGTVEQIQKTKEMFTMGLNLGRRGGEYRICGTVYHFADLHVELEKSGDWTVRKYPAPDEGLESWITSEELMKKRSLMGRDTYASQMLLNPIAEGIRTFELSWLDRCYYRSYPEGMNFHIVVDPAGGKNKANDYTVMWVFGVDYDKNFFIVDGLRDRLSLNEKWEKLISFVLKWRPRSVGYEKYGMQGDIEYVEEKMRETGQYFTLITLNHIKATEDSNGAAGKDRIKLLQPKFEFGKIKLPTYLPSYTCGKSVDLISTFIMEEYMQYPFPTHDDMLDALSRTCDPRMNIIYPMNPRPLVEKQKPFNYFNTKPVAQSGWRYL
jgi:phage terminase large subunit-like protein